jgi:hypothetical protein
LNTSESYEGGMTIREQDNRSLKNKNKRRKADKSEEIKWPWFLDVSQLQIS